MNYLLVFGLIAAACGAPQFNNGFRERFGPPPFFSDYRHLGMPHRSSNYFDTNKFWTDFSKEMVQMEAMLNDFSKHFPVTRSQEGIEGNEYRITIPLTGFEEKDIIVKAREGLLMIQAHHKYSEGSQRNYIDIRNLPDVVNVTGTWTFEKEVLKVVFPLKEGVSTPIVETVNVMSTDFTTKKPTFDREELIEDHADDIVDHDADVGLNRGDAEREIMTNEIQDNNAVEATTYAVDLKDEIEFVHIRK